MEDYVSEHKEDAFEVSYIIFLLNISEVIFTDLNEYDIDTEYEAISDSFLTSEFRALSFSGIVEYNIHIWAEIFYSWDHEIELFLIFTYD